MAKEKDNYRKTTIDIIVPCYNEEENIDAFFDAVQDVIEGIPGYEFSYIFVDDGSSDGTLDAIRHLAEISEKRRNEAEASEDYRKATEEPGKTTDVSGKATDNSREATEGCEGSIPEIRYISFSRNFGKEAAMYAGLKQSSMRGTDYAVLIDADLQHPPALIREMIDVIEETGCDSCAARRVSRKGEPRIRSMFARAFYKIMNRFSEIEIVDGAVDFRMMDRKMVKAIVDMPESQRFSKGIFSWVGFDTRWIEFENIKRLSGESKWNVWSLTRYAISGFVDFAEAPLKFMGFMGGIIWVGAGVYLIGELIKTGVFGKDVPGYESIICLILFFGGLLVAILSVIGQYIGRMYVETKRRPIYVEKESNFIGDDRHEA